MERRGCNWTISIIDCTCRSAFFTMQLSLHAEKLKGIVPFVAVDCDAEKNKPLCGQFRSL